jgi:hypothetical protein
LLLLQRKVEKTIKKKQVAASLPASLPPPYSNSSCFALPVNHLFQLHSFFSVHHSKIRESLTSSKISLLKSIKMTKKNFIKKNYCDQLFFLPQNPRPVGDPEVLGDERTN